MSIFASGSEVAIAVAAQALSQAKVAARVVSVPCIGAVLAEPEAATAATSSATPRCRVGVEAGGPLRLGRDHRRRPFIGMTGFGASGPTRQLYQHFGITPAKVARRPRPARTANA